MPGYGNIDENEDQKSQDFNFVAAGDFGCSEEAKKVINSMVKQNPEIAIALGDLSYNKSALCWITSVTPLNIDGRLKITFGDHDLTDKMIRYNTYRHYFNITTPYYSFDYNNVHFLAMATAKNSIIPYKNGSEQYNFVKDDLRKAHGNKSIDWIVVYSFRPFYSSLTEHSGQEVLPDTYHPLFDKYDVDIVLQAHNHNYQRTYPLIYNDSSLSSLYNPIIADENKIKYKDPNGTVFLTVGTGGAELHDFTGIAPHIVEQFESHGFLNIDFENSNDMLNLQGTFYESNMHKKDHFSITKKKVPDN